MNTKVIEFPRFEPRRTAVNFQTSGATMFMHYGKTTLIAHLAKPRGTKAETIQRRSKR